MVSTDYWSNLLKVIKKSITKKLLIAFQKYV